MWLTFCCLHSLQAFRLPPRRLLVTGGVFSISADSGLLCIKSSWGSLGDRKSLGGIKGGPFGANRCRYSKSIRVGRSSDIKPGTSASALGVRICRKSEKSACSERGEVGEGRAPPLIGCTLQRNSAVADSFSGLRQQKGVLLLPQATQAY